MLGRVDPGYLTARRDRQAGGQLPDQAEPQDHDLRPGTRLGQPEAVQGDGGDRGERGVTRGHAVGDHGAQQAWYGLVFRMVGLTRAAGCDQLAGSYPGDR